MKQRFFLIMFLVILTAGLVYPCTSVIIGKYASTDGSVLFGHNEDDGGQRVVNVWRVERGSYSATDSVRLISGVKIPQARETWAYFWFQMNGLEYSDLYMNEWGVTVASDACPTRYDKSKGSGAIGYMLRRILVERAQTAKEAVRIAGALLDSLGYSGAGRTLVVCDPNEAWLIAIPGGTLWAARRVPDDGAVVLPNQFIFEEVDFNDRLNWLFSKTDIRQYAIKQGWYDPAGSRAFHFSAVFGKSPDADYRQWRGQQLLAGRHESMQPAKSAGLPFAVTPRNKVSLSDVMALLRDHYKGTAFETRIGSCSENDRPAGRDKRIRPVCTSTTQYGVVAQLRNWLPWPASGVLWVSFGRPDCHPFLPWYNGISRIPEVYCNMPGVESADKALEQHFDQAAAAFSYDPKSAFWIQNELENIADMNYDESIKAIFPVRDSIEKRLIEFQPEFEGSMLRLWKKDPAEASAYCNEFIGSTTEEVMQKSMKLIRHLKTTNFD